MPAGPVNTAYFWQATDSYILTEFDDVFLVFHKLTGDTHVLNFLSAAILEIVEGTALQLPNIAEQVWNALQLGPDDCSKDLIEKTLYQLDEVGLVNPRISLDERGDV